MGAERNPEDELRRKCVQVQLLICHMEWLEQQMDSLWSICEVENVVDSKFSEPVTPSARTTRTEQSWVTTRKDQHAPVRMKDKDGKIWEHGMTRDVESLVKKKMEAYAMYRKLKSNKALEEYKGGRKELKQEISKEKMMEVTKMVDEGKVVDVIYTGFTKAFDKVPHGRLVQTIKHIWNPWYNK
eukprot:g42403.t1